MYVIENEYQRMATTFKNNFWKGKLQNRISPVKIEGGKVIFKVTFKTRNTEKGIGFRIREKNKPAYMNNYRNYRKGVKN